MVRAGKAVVECDNVCRKKKEELDRVRELEEEKKRAEEALKNQREIEMFEKKFKPKRKGKNRYQNTENMDEQSSHKWYWIIAACVIGVSTIIVLMNNDLLY